MAEKALSFDQVAISYKWAHVNGIQLYIKLLACYHNYQKRKKHCYMNVVDVNAKCLRNMPKCRYRRLKCNNYVMCTNNADPLTGLWRPVHQRYVEKRPASWLLLLKLAKPCIWFRRLTKGTLPTSVRKCQKIWVPLHQSLGNTSMKSLEVAWRALASCRHSLFTLISLFQIACQPLIGDEIRNSHSKWWSDIWRWIPWIASIAQGFDLPQFAWYLEMMSKTLVRYQESRLQVGLGVLKLK